MSRPASRQLAFLELLQSQRVVDGRAAAGELGVSERTIRRYVVALDELGIPVDGQPGVGGGYRLRPGTRLPPLMLTDEEAAAVVFGLVIAEQRGLGGTRGALTKISRVLPERLTRRVERLREELSVSGEPDPAPASGETLLLIAEAVRRRRTLEIDYARRDGTPSTREIDPLGSSHAGDAGTSRRVIARAASSARSEPTASPALASAGRRRRRSPASTLPRT